MPIEIWTEILDAMAWCLAPFIQWWIAAFIAAGIFAGIGVAWGSALRGMMRI